MKETTKKALKKVGEELYRAVVEILIGALIIIFA